MNLCNSLPHEAVDVKSLNIFKREFLVPLTRGKGLRKLGKRRSKLPNLNENHDHM